MAKFVVITPVLNGSKYISALLDSILVQTDPNWVHYLVDGGSTDGSIEIMMRAVEVDRRRKLLTGRDEGIYDAVFKGFERALSDGELQAETICTWLGSDDLLMPWAIATLRQKFDVMGAEWMGTIPAIWDGEGRLTMVLRQKWFLRELIQAGFCNPRILGGIQQESTFFTYALLAKVPAQTMDTIRRSKLAGDALLWRAFARHTDFIPIPTVVAGFRKHEANRSTLHREQYFEEIRNSGVWLPPLWLARRLQHIYRLFGYFAKKIIMKRVANQRLKKANDPSSSHRHRRRC
jgi:glycosyltransferase involved in cell wall biosynthesis